VGKFIDTCILFFTNVIVFSYFMPQEGVKESYGPFLLVGSIASFGLIEIVGKVGLMMADIEGERTIAHTLILPVKSVFVFFYIAIFWALSSALLSIFLFPIGKLLLFTRFDLEAISYGRIIPMFITINVFFGFFALWLTSVVKGLSGINNLWMRFIGPMWMFGAYLYSWHSSFQLSPLIAYLSLINPMVYVMEGMHAASLGQEGYLPFWVCLLALWGFIIACFTHANHRLKKRLDCV